MSNDRNDKTPAAVEIVDIGDPTVANSAIELIDQDVVRLESTPLHGRQVIARLEGVIVVYYSTNLRVRSRPCLHDELIGYVTFGPGVSGTVDGLPVGPDSMLAVAPGTEVGFVTNAGYENTRSEQQSRPRAPGALTAGSGRHRACCRAPRPGAHGRSPLCHRFVPRRRRQRACPGIRVQGRDGIVPGGIPDAASTSSGAPCAAYGHTGVDDRHSRSAQLGILAFRRIAVGYVATQTRGAARAEVNPTWPPLRAAVSSPTRGHDSAVDPALCGKPIERILECWKTGSNEESACRFCAASRINEGVSA